MHREDLGESFPTSIFLQNLVSIQLKTSTETSNFDFRITQRFNFPVVFSPETAPRQRSLQVGTMHPALAGQPPSVPEAGVLDAFERARADRYPVLPHPSYSSRSLHVEAQPAAQLPPEAVAIAAYLTQGWKGSTVGT